MFVKLTLRFYLLTGTIRSYSSSMLLAAGY